jgi:hypothetical protein
MNGFTKRWENKVRDYCDSQYEIIDVVAGDIHYNYKCHLNATHYAIENSDKKYAMVVYRQNNAQLPSVHFINYHEDTFIDNTIGHWCIQYEYRFIRWIPEKEFYDAVHLLRDTKKFFSDMATPLQKLYGEIDN